MGTNAKSLILSMIARCGLAATARLLDVGRDTLASYCAGAARQGTALLIESRIDRLQVRPGASFGEGPSPVPGVRFGDGR
jgi:hypothetical protein